MSESMTEWKATHFPLGESFEQHYRNKIALSARQANLLRWVVRLTDRLALERTMAGRYVLTIRTYGDGQAPGLVLEFASPPYPRPEESACLPDRLHFIDAVQALRRQLDREPMTSHFLRGELFQLGFRMGGLGCPDSDLGYWLFCLVGRLIQRHEAECSA